MNCPECGAEYREGFLRCTDCDVDLVPAPPPAPDDERSEIQLVKIFETGNAVAMSALESLLKEAGIDFRTSSEAAQDLYIGGRLGGSFSFPPFEFYVRSEDEDAALAIVEKLEVEEAPSPEEPE